MITTYQVGNEIYFYQIMADCVRGDRQRVILRSFNLVTHQLQIHDGPDNSCEIPIEKERGPLLSVSFLKKREHVTEINPRIAMRNSFDDEVPTECSLKS